MTEKASFATWSPVRLLSAAALCGAGVMVIELTATRALAPVFGSSLYTWTNVIGVVLLALAAGYWQGGRLADRHPKPAVLGKLVLGAAALSIPAPFLAVGVGEWMMPEPEALSPFVATGHVVRGSLATTLLLFAPPLCLLGMVGPFVTRCLQDTGIDAGTAAGRTLAISTLGSLVGTYLPAHFLIEQVGVRATLLLASGLLAAAGLILVSKGGGAAKAVAIGLCVVSVGGGFLANAQGVRGLLEHPIGTIAEIAIVEERETPYQYVRVSRWQSATENKEFGSELRLSLDEGLTEFHSVAREEPLTGYYYDVFALLPSVIEGKGTQPVSAIVLGGGAGTMAKMLTAAHGDDLARVVSVEIDPGVAAMAETFGWTPRHSDLSLVGDARVVLKGTSDRFDIIILDAYARQIAIPAHLGSVEFFELMASHLTDRGVAALNVSVTDLESPLMQSLHQSLQKVFANIAYVSVPNSWNVMILATQDMDHRLLPKDVPAAYAQAKLYWQQGWTRPHPTELEDLLLTDDRAPLEQLARQRGALR